MPRHRNQTSDSEPGRTVDRRVKPGDDEKRVIGVVLSSPHGRADLRRTKLRRGGRTVGLGERDRMQARSAVGDVAGRHLGYLAAGEGARHRLVGTLVLRILEGWHHDAAIRHIEADIRERQAVAVAPGPCARLFDLNDLKRAAGGIVRSAQPR